MPLKCAWEQPLSGRASGRHGAARRPRAGRPRSGGPRPCQAGSRGEGVPPSIGPLARGPLRGAAPVSGGIPGRGRPALDWAVGARPAPGRSARVRRDPGARASRPRLGRWRAARSGAQRPCQAGSRGEGVPPSIGPLARGPLRGAAPVSGGIPGRGRPALDWAVRRAARSGGQRPCQAGSRGEGVPPSIGPFGARPAPGRHARVRRDPGARASRPRLGRWRAARSGGPRPCQAGSRGEGVPPSIGPFGARPAPGRHARVRRDPGARASRPRLGRSARGPLRGAAPVSGGIPGRGRPALDWAVRRAARSGAPRPCQAGSRGEGVPPSIGPFGARPAPGGHARVRRDPGARASRPRLGRSARGPLRGATPVSGGIPGRGRPALDWAVRRAARSGAQRPCQGGSRGEGVPPSIGPLARGPLRGAAPVSGGIPGRGRPALDWAVGARPAPGRSARVRRDPGARASRPRLGRLARGPLRGATPVSGGILERGHLALDLVFGMRSPPGDAEFVPWNHVPLTL